MSGSTSTKDVSSRRLPYVVAALVAVVIGSAALPQAQARTPRQAADYVRSVTFIPEAQFITRSLEESFQGREGLIGRAGCERLFSNSAQDVTYRFTLSTTAPRSDRGVVDRIFFFAQDEDTDPPDFACSWETSTESCDNVDDLQDVDVNYLSGEQSATQNIVEITVPFRDLVNEYADNLPYEVEIIDSVEDCTREGDDAFDQQYFMRLFLSDQAREDVADAVIRIDTLRPPPPDAINDITATESTLHFSWEQEDKTDIDTFRAFWSTEDFTGRSVDELMEDSSVQSKQINVDDPDPAGSTFTGRVSLEGVPTDDPDTRIFVGISSRDEAENLSEPIFAEEGFEVLPVIDFWEGYREAGGTERGGCNSVGGALPAGAMGLLIFAGGLLWRRRRRS